MASVTCLPFSYALGALVALEGSLKLPEQPIRAPTDRSLHTVSSRGLSANPAAVASRRNAAGLTKETTGEQKLARVIDQNQLGKGVL